MTDDLPDLRRKAARWDYVRKYGCQCLVTDVTVEGRLVFKQTGIEMSMETM